MMSVTNAFEAITQFSVGERSTGDAWNKLVLSCADVVSTKEDLNDYLLPYEEKFMETFFSEEPTAKTNSGKWKFRTFMPKAYPSAKSTIGSALEVGISLLDENNNPVPKSIIAKQIKLAKSDSTEKTPYEKAVGHINSINNLLPKMSEEEIDLLRALISEV